MKSEEIESFVAATAIFLIFVSTRHDFRVPILNTLESLID